MTFDHNPQMGFAAAMSQSPDVRTVSPMADESHSSEHLIRTIALHRDRGAYAVLFARFSGRLKAFVMGRGLDEAQAEDLVQDAMLLVWRKAESFDPHKAQASTWIYTIIRNLRIDMARKAARAKPLPDNLWMDNDVIASDDQMIADQNAKSVRQELSHLPKDQIEVVRLTFFEDLTQTQIAHALNLPLGTVKSRLRLAMARLRKFIDQREDLA
jgi:RNA polymerase sigma-70 factor (ECF subfamily)